MHHYTVFLVTSEDLGWSEVRTKLEQMSDVEIIGEATTVCDACAMLSYTSPHAIFVPGIVEGTPSHTFLSLLRATCCSGSRVAIFASRLDREDVLLSTMRLASYFLWSDVSSRTLLWFLRIVLESTVVMESGAIFRALIDDQRRQYGTEHALLARMKLGLSRREVELLLMLVGDDLTYTQIGSRLNISTETVKAHVRHIGRKLGVTGRKAVVNVARDMGLVDLP